MPDEIDQHQNGNGNVQAGHVDNLNIFPQHKSVGMAPRIPALVCGRDADLQKIKRRIGIGADIQPITILTGWPGVGKTTFTSWVAYDPVVIEKFPDGVLWASLGEKKDPSDGLASWGRALGNDEILKVDPKEAKRILTAMLSTKKMLLIVDDVWDADAGAHFFVGGPNCATLVTTRFNKLAFELAPTKDDVYRLDCLTEDESLKLIEKITSGLSKKYSAQCLKLVNALERLPLALQVAGHLLNVESSRGFGVEELLVDLQDVIKVNESKAPEDRVDPETGTIPTVNALLERSTDRLDPKSRECFAFLAPFAHKPATFDMKAMAAVWEMDDPRPVVRTLVDFGLLEPIPETDRFWLHAILVAHARILLKKM